MSAAPKRLYESFIIVPHTPRDCNTRCWAAAQTCPEALPLDSAKGGKPPLETHLGEFLKKFFEKDFASLLHIVEEMCYNDNTISKINSLRFTQWQSPGELALSGAFLALGLLTTVPVPVKPFANIAGNYVCQNRHHYLKNNLHCVHPLPAPGIGWAASSLYHFRHHPQAPRKIIRAPLPQEAKDT